MKKLFIIFLITKIAALHSAAQPTESVSGLFTREGSAGNLSLQQDPRIDSLIGRYILMSRKAYTVNTYYGMNGYRVQIYNSSTRTAREESRRIRAEFMNKYPDIASDILFSEPSYYKVRIGNFRTKAQAAQVLRTISRDYRNAYIVPDFINLPELQRN